MAAANRCDHVGAIKVVADRDGVEGCEDCLKTGGRWVHLRMCLTCGHVGCCDSSPNRHARRHWETSGHPIIQSVEPREVWAWCFIDETLFEEAPPPATA
jgi:uncharacterized UBP type Zn finger protein